LGDSALRLPLDPASGRIPCFFCRHPATTVIYPLSLHDALPIVLFIIRGSVVPRVLPHLLVLGAFAFLVVKLHDSNWIVLPEFSIDRKSTRLNSSHVKISYAVFCLKKQKRAAVLHDPALPQGIA